MVPPVQVRLFGPVDVTVDGDPLDVDTRKAIALLAILVVEGTVSRDRAAALLWSDASEGRARASLRRTLSTLTRAVDGRGVDADRHEIALVRDEVWSDVGQLTETSDGESSAELAALRRGPFLHGFSVQRAAGFDTWMRNTGRDLDRRLTARLDTAIERNLAAGRLLRVEELVQARLAIEPTHEKSHALLVWLAGRQGDRDLVVERYRHCVVVLHDELGLSPQPRTTRLYEAALDGTSADVPDVDDRGQDDSTVATVLSLAGRPLPVHVLATATAIGVDDLARAVDRLVKDGTLQFSDDRVGVRSGRQRRRPDEELGPVRRMALHQRLAEALEGERGYEDLHAHHLAASGQRVAAAEAWERAARACRARNAFEEARHHLEEAIAAGHPERARLLVDIGDLDARRGRYAEAHDAYAAATVTAASDAERTAIELRLGRLQARRQQWAAAEVHLRAAASLGATASAELALVRYHLGHEIEEVMDQASHALEQAVESGHVDGVLAARNVLGIFARRTDRADDAVDLLTNGLALAPSEHPSRPALLNNLALAEYALGRLHEAEAHLQEAVDLLAQAGDLHREALALSNLADVTRERGDEQQARQLVLESATRLTLVGAGDRPAPELWIVQDW